MGGGDQRARVSSREGGVDADSCSSLGHRRIHPHEPRHSSHRCGCSLLGSLRRRVRDRVCGYGRCRADTKTGKRERAWWAAVPITNSPTPFRTPTRQRSMSEQTIPEYVRERILSETPIGCSVPENSLPQIVEGSLEESRIATIGLNLKEPRFHEEYSSTEQPLDNRALRKIWDDQVRYFESKRFVEHWLGKKGNPPYFGPLEQILNECKSTYGGLFTLDHPHKHHFQKAVSVDLVSWATKPTWGRLCPSIQCELLTDNKVTLSALIRDSSFDFVFATSRTVVEELKYLYGAQVFSQERIAHSSVRLSCGEVYGKRLIGWNIPPSRLGTAVDALAKRVGELYRSGCN